MNAASTSERLPIGSKPRVADGLEATVRCPRREIMVRPWRPGRTKAMVGTWGGRAWQSGKSDSPLEAAPLPPGGTSRLGAVEVSEHLAQLLDRFAVAVALAPAV